MLGFILPFALRRGLAFAQISIAAAFDSTLALVLPRLRPFLFLILSFVIAGLLWFALGSRIALAEDSSENDLANLVLYALGSLPVSFVIVFFGLGG